ncbi:dienelactone hydrolase [Prauserella isguenensis]|uniref:Dienelactone hydrolase n=1 Tax=Prauserella isguenensis TaxID=1470180 RepID=A0A839RYD4_9PSEU|nr:dienelactone hydrolase [Prauserella isguenensis]
MRRTTVTTLLSAAVLALTTALVGPAGQAAHAAGTYQHGPDPTEDSIEAPRGPFSVAEERVSSLVRGFGGGTIYYPTATDEGPFAGIAISPGYTASQSSIAWLGPRLASQGFVVFTIDTNSRYDQPGSRADQLNAALGYLTDDSDVTDRVDPERLGVAGHSMGGGGSLEATVENPDIDAAVPFAPWHTRKDFSALSTPTFIIGGESDSVAPVRRHSEPFYESIPDSTDKAYMELERANHFFPNSPDTTTAKYTLSWFKLFLDDDERYAQFLCPAPDDRAISEYRDTCPY